MDIGQISGRSPISSRCFVVRNLHASKHHGTCRVHCSLSDKNRMFVFGVGFVGKFIAAQLKREGWHISGTCTSVAKKKELEEIGVEAFFFDAKSQDLRNPGNLEDASHLLISIPPIAGLGDPLLELHRDLLQTKLTQGHLQWLCYLSSTSVYGDASGAWVDEACPAKATSKSAKARLIAEKGWLDMGNFLGIQAVAFRLGGIYGPGRSALDTVLKQEALSQKQWKRGFTEYTSRVHVADVYQALKASINMPSSAGIYNVVDDDPAPRAEVFSFAKELIEKKWPGKLDRIVASPDTSTGKKAYTRGEKRVSNARMKKELKVSLIHPSYRSGLRSISEAMQFP